MFSYHDLLSAVIIITTTFIVARVIQKSQCYNLWIFFMTIPNDKCDKRRPKLALRCPEFLICSTHTTLYCIALYLGSKIRESNETLFWSDLVNGLSIVPSFIMVMVTVGSFIFTVLFTIVSDLPYAQGIEGLGRFCSYFLLSSVLCRNILISSYECMIDGVAHFPLISPIMLQRLRLLSNSRSKSIDELMMMCQTIQSFFIMVSYLANLYLELTPDILGVLRWVFFPNYLVKLVGWYFYIYNPHHKTNSKHSPVFIDYFCFSDALIFGVMMAVYYVRQWLNGTDHSTFSPSDPTGVKAMEQELMVSSKARWQDLDLGL